MLHREDAGGTIIVAQPAHAWISAQMAEEWGAEPFERPHPYREVCAAAGQHDIAWLPWEAEPRLNPDTGMPYSFRNMPTLMHLSVWEPAGRLALAYGRYAALLVSMHGTYLYERFHDYEGDTDEEVAAARTFLDRGKSFQQDLIAALREDPAYQDTSGDERIETNRRLVALWDALSLALCEGFEGRRQFDGVPSAEGPRTLTLAPLDDGQNAFTMDPWPFRSDTLTVACDGRRIAGPFASEGEMRAAIEAAPWIRLEFILRPA